MMPYTEEEAKKKWCPMAIKSEQLAYEYCIASLCSMWRWERYVEDRTTGEVERRDPSIAYTEPYAPVDNKYGCCGLAGRWE